MTHALEIILAVIVAVPFVLLCAAHAVGIGAVVLRGLGVIGDKEVEWLSDNM